MAIVNFPEFSVKIILSNSEELVFTHANGLKNIRAGRTFTSDNSRPAYGIISQEGVVELFDAKGEIYNLIEANIITPEQRIEIYFTSNLVGVYTTQKIIEKQENLFEFYLEDTLIQWQRQTVQQKYELELNKTAKDLYDYLISLNEDLDFLLDATTERHLQAIKVKHYYWEKSSKWELWQKLCDLAQLYVFMNKEGKIEVLSQQRINELQFTNKNNAIVIPLNCMDGMPTINRINKSKITKVEGEENVITSETGEILNTRFTVQDDNGNFVLQNPPVQSAEIVDVSGVKKLRFIQEVKNTDYIIKDLPAITDANKKAYFELREKKGGYTSDGGKVDIMGAWNNKDEYAFGMANCAQLNKHTTLNNRCYAIDTPIVTTGGADSDRVIQSVVLAEKFFVNTRSFSLGEGEESYTINPNELISADTKVKGINILEYNATQILNNSSGVQDLAVSCAIITLKDLQDNIVYEYKSGELLQPLDLIYVQSNKPEIRAWNKMYWYDFGNISGRFVWADGKKTYYSQDYAQGKLNKETNKWETITWNGMPQFRGEYVWTDDKNIYYSFGTTQKRLNKTTSTWEDKSWNIEYDYFTAPYDIWKDGNSVYLSSGPQQYVLEKLSGTWEPKEWHGLTYFSAGSIWHLGGETYYSSSEYHYALNRATSTWEPKEWGGLTSFDGANIWHSEKETFYSQGSNQYILNKETSTWERIKWTGYANISARDIWTDGDSSYYSYGGNQYVLYVPLLDLWQITGVEVEASSGKNFVNIKAVAIKEQNTDRENWKQIQWSGLDTFDGKNIWHSSGDTYYSDGAGQYKLNKDNNVWEPKEWSGIYPSFGSHVWNLGEVTYYSFEADQFVLNKSTGEWEIKIWNNIPVGQMSGRPMLRGNSIWTLDDEVYFTTLYWDGRTSLYSYMLNKETSTWEWKSWNNGGNVTSGSRIWSLEDDFYYSFGEDQYILNKTTSTWELKEWGGIPPSDGANIWNLNENTYYSKGVSQYILNKATSTWESKKWSGLTNFDGANIWKSNGSVYYSEEDEHYILNKEIVEWDYV